MKIPTLATPTRQHGRQASNTGGEAPGCEKAGSSPAQAGRPAWKGGGIRNDASL